MPEDLLKFGMIPELVGRLRSSPACTTWTARRSSDPEPSRRNALVKRVPALLSWTALTWSSPRTPWMRSPNQANLRGTAPRLRAILEEVLQPVMYEVPSRKDVERVSSPAKWSWRTSTRPWSRRRLSPHAQGKVGLTPGRRPRTRNGYFAGIASRRPSAITSVGYCRHHDGE